MMLHYDELVRLINKSIVKILVIYNEDRLRPCALQAASYNETLALKIEMQMLC